MSDCALNFLVDSFDGISLRHSYGAAAEAKDIRERIDRHSAEGASSELVLAAGKAALSAKDKDLCRRAADEIESLEPGVGRLLLTELRAVLGDADGCIRAARGIAFVGTIGEVSPSAAAVWGLCIAGAPERAWEVEPAVEHDDLLGCIAMLRASFLTENQAAQRAWMDRLLDTAEEAPVVADPFIPSALDIEVSATSWLCEVLEEIGSRVFWLTERRRDVIHLARAVGIDFRAGDGMDAALIRALMAGDILAAIEEFKQLALECDFQSAGLPVDWVDIARNADIGEETKWEAAYMSEGLLLDGLLSDEAVSLWYFAIWERLIDNMEPICAATLHKSVAIRAGSKRAAMNAARAYMGAGFYADAIEIAGDLLRYYSFHEDAEHLIRSCERQARRAASGMFAVGSGDSMPFSFAGA